MTIKEAYYYLYYRLYKAWRKNYNPLLSADFRTDISIIAIKIWFLGLVGIYLSILLGVKLPRLSLTSPMVFIPFALAVGSTLYFFTFSNRWKPYFEKFEKWPKRKNRIGGIIVWGIIILLFINLLVSVELMKKLNR